ncbi:MAG: alpha/beta hydrolase fold domain-containing protein [Planctomycetes bacterium]|nr:alpha/beta hydrolase fold domain-containing protein [Planctomycetota bacterium]
MRLLSAALLPTCLATSLAACLSTALAPAQQQFRYRDPVFAQVTRQNAIAYGSAFNRATGQQQQLLLDWYEPNGDPAASRPVCVVVHGGGFVGGGRGTSQMVALCSRLARSGYTAVSIDYRLTTSGSPITQQVVEDAAHDFQAAVRWLRANATARRLDEGRIAAIGSSAGSYTALHSAYAFPGEGTSGNPGFSSRVAAVVDLWGALLDPNTIDAGEAPLQIVHGTLDGTVPYAQALALQARAQAIGLPHEFHPMVGAGHAPWTDYFTSFFDDTQAFLWQHLDLAALEGLAVRPGAASPGTATFDHGGLGGDFVLLALGFGTANTTVPELGTFCLNPNDLVLTVGSTVLPTGDRLGSGPFAWPVPAGLLGVTLHWQALQIGAWNGLTNCVATPL